MVSRKNIILLVAIAVYIVSSGQIIFAQTEENSNNRMNECMNNLSIDNLRLTQEQLGKYMGLLVDSFLCFAIVKDDINQCNKLGPGADFCKEIFNKTYGFYYRLIVNRQVNAAALSGCKGQGCDTFARAFLAGDVAMCDKSPDKSGADRCKALITADANKCGSDSDCRDTVFYIKAVKTSDPRLCDAIISDGFKIACKASLSKNKNTCEECEGFKQFKMINCSK